MPDQATIQAPKMLISTFLAKFVLLLLLGSVIGLFDAQNEFNKYEIWKTMNPAQKKAFLVEQNQEYEKSMKQEPSSFGLTWIVWVGMFWAVFSLYELLGKGMGLVIARVIPLRETEP